MTFMLVFSTTISASLDENFVTLRLFKWPAVSDNGYTTSTPASINYELYCTNTDNTKFSP